MMDDNEQEVLLKVEMPLITQETQMTKDVFAQIDLPDKMDYEQARVNMVTQQIRTWDVTNKKILKLFYKTPREDFVPAKYRSLAFADLSIPLAHVAHSGSRADKARSIPLLIFSSILRGKIFLFTICMGNSFFIRHHPGILHLLPSYFYRDGT